MHADELISQLRAPDQRGVGRIRPTVVGVDNIDTLARLDAAAHEVRVWDSTVIPGNLQTPAYSMALIRAAHPRLSTVEARRRMLLKSARAQAFLGIVRTGFEGRAHFIIGERAIRQPLTDGNVHPAQISYLATLAETEGLIIRILPDGIVAPGLADRFALYDLGDDQQMGYVETIMGGYYSTRNDDLNRLGSVYDAIGRVAMSPKSTIRFLREVIETWRFGNAASPALSRESPSSSRLTPRRETTALEWHERTEPEE